MKVPENMMAEEILKQFCVYYNSRDLEKLLKLFTNDTKMLGSAVDEYRVGHAEIEKQFFRDWGQSEASEIEVVSFIPSTPGSQWAAAFCKAIITVAGEKHVFEDFRGTIAIEKENGIWKIAHMHASFPDVRNAKDSSFPLE